MVRTLAILITSAVLTLVTLVVVSSASAQTRETTYTARSGAGRIVTVTVSQNTVTLTVRNAATATTIPANLITATITNQATGASRELRSGDRIPSGRYQLNVRIRTRLGIRPALDTATVPNVVIP